MKLIVGLGNPGDKYAETRHNVGFWVVDALSKRLGIPCERSKWRGLIGEGHIGHEKVLLCKPQTFMNLSGESIREVVSFYDTLSPESDVLVVYDDMDFEPGHMKLRLKGRSGGHNGIKSTIAHLGTEAFPRVRMGIGRPGPGRDVLSHVLGTFAAEEESRVQAAVTRAAEAIEYAVVHSFHAAMNHYNEATRLPEA